MKKLITLTIVFTGSLMIANYMNFNPDDYGNYKVVEDSKFIDRLNCGVANGLSMFML